MPAEPGHCLGRDPLCTCQCGKDLPPEDAILLEDRGRICQECQSIDGYEKAEREMESCTCMWSDISGRSVCGHPCPVHKEGATQPMEKQKVVKLCRCCGGVKEDQIITRSWCNRCSAHVKPDVPIWEATFYAQYEKYCPFTTTQFIPFNKKQLEERGFMKKELNEQEQAFVRDGAIIPAIKSVRDRMGWNLIKAKAFVEDEAERLGIEYGSHDSQMIRRLNREVETLRAEVVDQKTQYGCLKIQEEAALKERDNLRAEYEALQDTSIDNLRRQEMILDAYKDIVKANVRMLKGIYSKSSLEQDHAQTDLGRAERKLKEALRDPTQEETLMDRIRNGKRHLLERSDKEPDRISMIQYTKELLCMSSLGESLGYSHEDRTEMAKNPLIIMGLNVVIDKNVPMGCGRIGHSEMELDVILITTEESNGSGSTGVSSGDSKEPKAGLAKG